MFYNSSNDDVDFSTEEHYYIPKKNIENTKLDKKNCILILILIIMLIILIVGITLAIYFSSKNKENGGEIIIKYLFNYGQNFPMFNLIDFNNDDFDIEYDDKDTPLRLLRDQHQHFKPEDKCTNGTTCIIKIKFKKVINNLEGMFSNIQELNSADFSNFNSRKITNMNKLFFNCTNLASVNFNNFDAKKLLSMDSMFENCSKIQNIDLSSFKTPKLESMNSAFKGCNNLFTLNIKNFKLYSNLEMDNVFKGCESLKDFIYPNDNNEVLMKEYNKNNFNNITCQEGIECIQCDEIKIENSNSNFNLSICISCPKSYFLDSDLKFNIKCQKCFDNCLKCKNSKTCDECDINYDLINNNTTCKLKESSTIINSDIIESTFIPNSDLPTD